MRNFQNKVRVIRIWKWNNFQVELCIFKPNVDIALHTHDDVDVEVMHIFGSALYERRDMRGNNKYYAARTLKDRFRCFSVPADYAHGANIGSSGLITLSIQRWHHKPSLITEDYHEGK